MRLLRLQVERFRGIRSLDWHVPDRLACLVGPGDTGKSTVLDAVTLVTTPGNATFEVDDFFALDTAEGLTIEATFADLPSQHPLLAESRFGLHLGGVDAEGRLLDEPGDDEPTITIRLHVDESLEPSWRVVTAADPEGRLIGRLDRASLGVSSVGSDTDRQFTWGRGTALARISGEALADPLTSLITLLGTAAGEVDLSGLDQAVNIARDAGVRLGAGPISQANAEVDVPRLTGSHLALHADGIPVAASGLGSRRLLALGIELAGAATGGVVCLDELEAGLEPHRIRHLVQTLVRVAGEEQGQVLFTSHSPTVIEEVGARFLHTVRSDAGTLTITPTPEELTRVVRANASALLARRTIVAEGKTEMGLLRAYGDRWAGSRDGRSLAFEGVSVVDGGGTSAPARARSLHTLGYPTLLFADSDAPLNPTADDLRGDGVEVLQWPGAMCTEQRIITDLSWDGVQELCARLPELGFDPEQYIAAMLSTPAAQDRLKELDASPDQFSDLDALVAASFDQNLLRECLWRAATTRSGGGWFKLIDSGRVLGEVAAGDTALQDAPAGESLRVVEAWAYGGD